MDPTIFKESNGPCKRPHHQGHSEDQHRVGLHRKDGERRRGPRHTRAVLEINRELVLHQSPPSSRSRQARNPEVSLLQEREGVGRAEQRAERGGGRSRVHNA